MKPLGFREFRALVESMTYKPGWSFSASYQHQAYEVRLTYRVEDSSGEDRQVLISSELLIHPDCEEDIVKALIHEHIVGLERHEVDEWLRFGGVHFHEPHGTLPIPL